MEKRKTSFIKSRAFLIISALLSSFIFFAYAPFELYLTNIDDMWFTLKDFWWMPVLFFIIAFFVIFAIGCFMQKRIRNIYSAAFFGGGLALYLQGNFLFIDMGQLNGGEIIWSDYTKNFTVNILIWLLIIAVPIVLYLIFKNKAIKIFTLLASFLLLIQTVTLGTLFISKSDSLKKNVGYSVTDANLLDVSSDKNAVVFILDMFDERYFKEIINLHPEVKDQYSDFTFFENATGSYSTTSYSVASLIIGAPIRNEGATFIDTINKNYEKTSMFNELKSENYALDLYTKSPLPQDLLYDASNYKPIIPHISDNKSFIKKLYRLAVCRYAPDAFKQRFWMDGTEFNGLQSFSNSDLNPYSDENIDFYNSIKDEKLVVTDEKRFKFIHITGAHYPYKINSKIEPIEGTNDNKQTLDTAIGSLNIVKAYIDKMKEAGVYDNSTIIIMSDHGYYWDGVLTNPLIMVKEVGAHKSFSISDAPVSHYDFQATIMQSLGNNQNQEYGKSMFDIEYGEKRNRIFYQYNLQEESKMSKYRLIEYAVSDQDNSRKYFSLTGNQYSIEGKLENHFENCEYCKEHGTEPVDAPNDAIIVHSPKK